jgi:hypothetical protein
MPLELAGVFRLLNNFKRIGYAHRRIGILRTNLYSFGSIKRLSKEGNFNCFWATNCICQRQPAPSTYLILVEFAFL